MTIGNGIRVPESALSECPGQQAAVGAEPATRRVDSCLVRSESVLQQGASPGRGWDAGGDQCRGGNSSAHVRVEDNTKNMLSAVGQRSA